MRESRWLVRSSRVRRGVVAMFCVSLLALTACVGSAGSDAAEGEGVDPGAGKEAYVQALAGSEPITLTVQSVDAPGQTASRAWDAYAAAIKDWSGGQIEVEVVYSNAIAPPAEVNSALADGRLDLSMVIPGYEPARFPASNALADLSFLGRHSQLVGVLQTSASFLEAAWATPEIHQEYEREDVKLLLPFGPVESPGLACSEQRESLGETRGVPTRVAGSVHIQQIKALGMSEVSLPFTELYEGLQRGTVECAVTGYIGAAVTGIVPVAKHWTIHPETGFGRIPFGLGFGLAEWESLPLAAQQLLYDRIDVFLEEWILGQWESSTEVLASIEKEGGSVSQFDAGARDALQRANEQIVNDARGSEAVEDGDAFVRRVSDAADKWLKIVTEELGYTDKVGDDEFASWFTRDAVDLDGFIDRVRSDILAPHRPGS